MFFCCNNFWCVHPFWSGFILLLAASGVRELLIYLEDKYY